MYNRPKLMVGGAVGAVAVTVGIPALTEEEGSAPPGTITEFQQFLVKFQALPPKVQKAVLTILNGTHIEADERRGLRIRYKNSTTPTRVGPQTN